MTGSLARLLTAAQPCGTHQKASLTYLESARARKEHSSSQGTRAGHRGQKGAPPLRLFTECLEPSLQCARWSCGAPSDSEILFTGPRGHACTACCCSCRLCYALQPCCPNGVLNRNLRLWQGCSRGEVESACGGVVWCGGGGGGGGAPAMVPRTVSRGVVPRGPHAGSAEGVLRLTSARVRRISSHT